MNALSERAGAGRALLALASIVIIIAGMRAASDLLIPFLLAAFLAIICLPPLGWLRRRGAPTWFSVIVVATVMVVIVTILAGIVGTSIRQFTQRLPVYQRRIEQQAARLEEWVESVESWLSDKTDRSRSPDESHEAATVPNESDGLPELGAANSAATDSGAAEDGVPAAAVALDNATTQTEARHNQSVSDTLFQQFNSTAVMRFFAGTLSSLAAVLSNTFLILLTVIFILLEASGIPTKLKAIAGPTTAGPSTLSESNLHRVVSTVNRYMTIKTVTSLGTAVIITAWLMVLGVDFALLWGLLAFILNFVPNIGSILAAVPAVLLALVQLGFGSALAVALGYTVVNVLVGCVIEPRYMGRGLGLSTLVVFVSLVFWGWVLGAVGMLLSVPLTMTAKIALESNEDTRWIAILLGTESDAAAIAGTASAESVDELIKIDPAARGLAREDDA